MELILVFPVILTFFCAMGEFSMILYSRQQLCAASREAARVAARGGDRAEVEWTVKRYLGNGRLGDCEVEITDAAGNFIDTTHQIHSGEPVEVWCRLPTAHAVPDLLRFVGLSIRDDEMVGRTVMRKE